MIKICLTRFIKDPWTTMIIDGFFQALNDNKTFEVEKIFSYPEKKYDLIILIGVRAIVKRNLDVNKILPYCSKLIDMGDNALDSRRNYEDAYIYFIPSKKKLYNHYYYLPKFVFEELLPFKGKKRSFERFCRPFQMSAT